MREALGSIPAPKTKRQKKKKRQEVNNASENVREKESLYITDRNVENSVEFLLKSQK
jgi:hypothetical protein